MVMDQPRLLSMELSQVGMVELTLPFLPQSKNKWEGWDRMWKAGERKKWARHLDRELSEVGLRCGCPVGEEDSSPHPEPGSMCPDPIATRVNLAIEIWHGSKRRRDWQNYFHPMMWFVADALKRNGTIRDDTPEHFVVGENGGITFMVDSRSYVPAADRQRTILRVSLEDPEGRG